MFKPQVVIRVVTRSLCPGRDQMSLSGSPERCSVPPGLAFRHRCLRARYLKKCSLVSGSSQARPGYWTNPVNTSFPGRKHTSDSRKVLNRMTEVEQCRKGSCQSVDFSITVPLVLHGALPLCQPAICAVTPGTLTVPSQVQCSHWSDFAQIPLFSKICCRLSNLMHLIWRRKYLKVS